MIYPKQCISSQEQQWDIVKNAPLFIGGTPMSQEETQNSLVTSLRVGMLRHLPQTPAT